MRVEAELGAVRLADQSRARVLEPRDRGRRASRDMVRVQTTASRHADPFDRNNVFDRKRHSVKRLRLAGLPTSVGGAGRLEGALKAPGHNCVDTRIALAHALESLLNNLGCGLLAGSKRALNLGRSGLEKARLGCRSACWYRL